jgi:hypothetical protein
MAAMLVFFSLKYRFHPKFESTFIIYYPIPVYRVSSKKNARIIRTYHSKTIKHIKIIQVLKCGERT